VFLLPAGAAITGAITGLSYGTFSRSSDRPAIDQAARFAWRGAVAGFAANLFSIGALALGGSSTVSKIAAGAGGALTLSLLLRLRLLSLTAVTVTGAASGAVMAHQWPKL